MVEPSVDSTVVYLVVRSADSTVAWMVDEKVDSMVDRMADYLVDLMVGTVETLVGVKVACLVDDWAVWMADCSVDG